MWHVGVGPITDNQSMTKLSPLRGFLWYSGGAVYLTIDTQFILQSIYFFEKTSKPQL